jgi:ribonuclease HII
MNCIAGADEVGRGAFAGPVVAACVIFPESFCAEDVPVGIRVYDSKKLSASQREKASIWIQKNAISWGIGEGSVEMINTQGIMPATYLAFQTAIAHAKPDHARKLLVDGYKIPSVVHFTEDKQEAIIKGDQLSLHIAAASIIAKVYRDALMIRLSEHKKHMPYVWHENKGYGTETHRNAIKQYGVTVHHRTLFCKNYI